MRVALGAISDVPASCGSDPCGAWDYVWVSDECEQYLSCAGLPPMTFSGQLGAGVKSITGGTASVVGQGAKGLFSDPVGAVLIIAALGAAVFVAVKL